MMGDNYDQDAGLILYRRFRSGDETALRELIELYGKSLLLFLYGIVGNMDDAEELMIDAFTRLVGSNDRFQGKSTLKTYLFGIGRNLALSHLRAHKNRAHVPFQDTGFSGDEASPEENLIRDERGVQLDIAMGKLKPEYRQVLRLLYFYNMSCADAGKEMRKTQRQIVNLAYRARASLRKKLESEGFTYDDRDD